MASAASARVEGPDDDDLPFEEEVLRNPYHLKAWWRYLEAKRDAPAKTRNILHERALQVLPGSYKLWHQYLLERRHQVRGRRITDPAFEAVNAVFERALVFMHKMPRIWIEYLQFLMAQKLITRTRRTFDRALRALPITQHERIWELYVKFIRQPFVPADTALVVYRRYIKLEATAAEDFIEFLIGADRLDEAARELARVVNDDEFISTKGKTRHQVWLQLCDLIAHNPDRVTSLPVEQVIRQGIEKFTEMTGRLWTALADFHIRKAHFEKARDVYEEALASVSTVRDFSVVFDAYSQFEESMITAKMAQTSMDDAEQIGDEIDLRLTRFARLMDRRPFLLNSVLLRQNPHNVTEWLKRARLFAAQGDHAGAIKAYSDGVKTVDAQKAVGRPQSLWIAFARFYEERGDMEGARLVLQKAVEYAFRTVDDLATVWCEWAEMELRHGDPQRAIDVLKAATRIPPARKLREEGAKVQLRVHRSNKLWCFLADLLESTGAYAGARAAYDQMIDLKVATARAILNYAQMLEEQKYYEDAFRVYEKGVSLFTFPAVMELWVVYLTKFVRRYGGRKLERARDLFEQALEKAPPAQAKTLFLLYARLEEEHGLARRALAIYARAVKACDPEARPELYAIYLARAAEFAGAAATRPIHEEAIATLADKYVPAACMRYAALEVRMGEIDRARAIFGHGAQVAEPRLFPEFWQAWQEFEVRHGNDDTFRDMLRIKRTVQTRLAQVAFLQQVEALKKEEASRKRTAPVAFVAGSVLPGSQPAEPGAMAINPDEIALDEAPVAAAASGAAAEVANVALETLPVPSAVFGGYAAEAEAQGGGEGGGAEPMGAMERIKRHRK